MAPQIDRSFILSSDAARIGLRDISSQEDSLGQERPVAFFSQGLIGAEMNYTVTCLVVVAAVKHFSFYLESKPFKVVTDHRSLLYLDKMKDSKACLTRWALSLQLYIHKIVH